jgi:hypothetical protein
MTLHTEHDEDGQKFGGHLWSLYDIVCLQLLPLKMAQL